MIKLIRGNEDSLEGRVLIYSSLSSPKENKFLAIYASSDLLDFANRIGISEEITEEMNKQEEKNREFLEGFKNLVKEKLGIEDVILPASLRTHPLEIESEEEIYAGNNDILFTGNYNFEPLCKHSVLLGFQLYSLDWLNMVQTNKKNNSKSDKKPEKIIRYTEVPNLNEYLARNFIVPIIDSYSFGRTNDTPLLKKSLIDFCEGAPFMDDVLEVIEIIETRREKTNPLIIQDYINKIHAIHTEDYLTAAELRNRINSWKKSNSAHKP